jgi:phosphoglycerate dehydrogenase-like enzyme
MNKPIRAFIHVRTTIAGAGVEVVGADTVRAVHAGRAARLRVIGVVGTGRIECRVIEIARSFGMNVIAHDLQRDEAAAARLCFAYTSLDQLLSDSDVLTLHVPATFGTHRMISDREFSRMKQGAISDQHGSRQCR